MKRKGMLEALQQFEEDGYVTHYCPECEAECEPTEIDSNKAYCPVCEKVVKVPQYV